MDIGRWRQDLKNIVNEICNKVQLVNDTTKFGVIMQIGARGSLRLSVYSDKLLSENLFLMELSYTSPQEWWDPVEFERCMGKLKDASKYLIDCLDGRIKFRPEAHA